MYNKFKDEKFQMKIKTRNKFQNKYVLTIILEIVR